MAFIKTIKGRLIVACILAALAAGGGVLALWSTEFHEDQIKLMENATGWEARAIAQTTEQVVNGWAAHLKTGVTAVGRSQDAHAAIDIQGIVDSHPDFVSAHLIFAPSRKSTQLRTVGEAFTSLRTDNRFGDRSVLDVWRGARTTVSGWLKSEIPKAKQDDILTRNLGPAVQVPLSAIAIRFDIANSASVIWAVAVVWPTQILAALPSQEEFRGVVLNRKGALFAGGGKREMLAGVSSSPLGPILATTVASTGQRGTHGVYQGPDGERRVGAFEKINHLGLTVFTERNVENVLAITTWATQYSILTIALIVLLMFPVAIYFAKGVGSATDRIKEAAERFGAGELDLRLPPALDEFSGLDDAFNNMAENLSQGLAAKINEIQAQHLGHIHSEYQNSVLPERLFKDWPMLTIASFHKAANTPQGAFWGKKVDVERRIVTIYVGEFDSKEDATIRGAVVKGLLDGILISQPTFDEPSVLISHFRSLRDTNRGLDYPIKLGVYQIDLNGGKLTYALAGQVEPIIATESQTDRFGSNLSPGGTDEKGQSLKARQEPTIEKGELPLAASDKIFVTTVGLTQGVSPDGQAWGAQTFKQLVTNHVKLAADELHDEVLSQAFTHFDQEAQSQDVLMLSMQVASSWQPTQDLGASESIATPAPPPIVVIEESAAVSSETPQPPAIEVSAEDSDSAQGDVAENTEVASLDVADLGAPPIPVVGTEDSFPDEAPIEAAESIPMTDEGADAPHFSLQLESDQSPQDSSDGGAAPDLTAHSSQPVEIEDAGEAPNFVLADEVEANQEMEQNELAAETAEAQDENPFSINLPDMQNDANVDPVAEQAEMAGEDLGQFNLEVGSVDDAVSEQAEAETTDIDEETSHAEAAPVIASEEEPVVSDSVNLVEEIVANEGVVAVDEDSPMDNDLGAISVSIKDVEDPAQFAETPETKPRDVTDEIPQDNDLPAHSEGLIPVEVDADLVESPMEEEANAFADVSDTEAAKMIHWPSHNKPDTNAHARSLELDIENEESQEAAVQPKAEPPQRQKKGKKNKFKIKLPRSG